MFYNYYINTMENSKENILHYNFHPRVFVLFVERQELVEFAKYLGRGLSQLMSASIFRRERGGFDTRDSLVREVSFDKLSSSCCSFLPTAWRVHKSQIPPWPRSILFSLCHIFKSSVCVCVRACV